ncbi:helix-turn-helix domain-containing protein [Paraburkholderia caribensis]|uniref:helix-turn-helix domain-containing protein n=1 Tax=Paraburkholderia caribensis TaxID=75105 RepID=UPI00286BA8C9|nr:helix-turn-helix transcriptional regulator [Paraburkholderia caribensis]
MPHTAPKTQRQSARTILAVNLRRMRAELAWSQEDLAAEAGLDRSFVAHVERGARNISIDNLEKLAVALAVPIARLLEQ